MFKVFVTISVWAFLSLYSVIATDTVRPGLDVPFSLSFQLDDEDSSSSNAAVLRKASDQIQEGSKTLHSKISQSMDDVKAAIRAGEAIAASRKAPNYIRGGGKIN